MAAETAPRPVDVSSKKGYALHYEQVPETKHERKENPSSRMTAPHLIFEYCS